jgi:carbonic anhydrase
MKLNLVFSLLIVLVVFSVNVNLIPILESEENEEKSDAEWDYEKYGPDVWPALHGTSCGNAYQSPIEIHDEDVNCDIENLKLLELNEYEKNIDFKFIHDGHTIVAYPSYERFPLEIGGTGLSDDQSPYQLLQFHFHWSSNYNE